MLSLQRTFILLMSLIVPFGGINHTSGSATPPASNRTLWHAGTFRYLEAILVDDFVTYAEGLAHSYSGYGKLSSTRKDKFNIFLDALFAAIDASLVDGSSGDWCGVKAKASTAGYEVFRLYDRQAGRWFIFGRDATGYGQAYFFINPFAKRNIVIEVPHAPLELDTKAEGARLFLGLAARALIINKADRCSDPDTSGCFLGHSPTVCEGRYRESDVAHHPDNTFHLLHVRYTDMDTVTKFVQLHGFGGSSSDMAEIGDVTKNDYDRTSISVVFANNLDRYVPTPSAVDSCQQYAGSPPSGLCGETNLQGRHTNDPQGNACMRSTDAHSGRILHIEQARTLRDNDDSDGWYWGDILHALYDTWPDCNMNNGATDCTLGSRQTEYSTLSCANPSVRTMKVTFYGYPDNDDGSGNFGTNVIARSL